MNIPFAVWHEGIPDNERGEQQGRWVLAVDAEHDRLLLCNDERELYWMNMGACKPVRVHTVDMPIPVVPVQIQQAPQIVQAAGPLPTRADRRAVQFGRA